MKIDIRRPTLQQQAAEAAAFQTDFLTKAQQQQQNVAQPNFTDGVFYLFFSFVSFFILYIFFSTILIV